MGSSSGSRDELGPYEMSPLSLSLGVICCITMKEKPQGPSVAAAPVLGGQKWKGVGAGDGI